MLTLGIKSTCNQTGVAVVEDGKKVSSNVVALWADIHRQYRDVSTPPKQ